MDDKFFEMVHFLYIICWQALGKITNPATGKTEKNIPFAKSIIEIFEMLEKKTKGNLDAEEIKTLENVLADLKLNYVNELNSEGLKQDEHQEQKESKPEGKAEESA
ncbi:MAG: DUF1844 domain-containing protein [Candidatus Omnitrophica bacterium]|nr:DUF1844 domain-containing protein [Candidatus Omnitrophota bacterium]